jgi:hypothetical protein
MKSSTRSKPRRALACDRLIITANVRRLRTGHGERREGVGLVTRLPLELAGGQRLRWGTASGTEARNDHPARDNIPGTDMPEAHDDHEKGPPSRV